MHNHIYIRIITFFSILVIFCIVFFLLLTVYQEKQSSRKVFLRDAVSSQPTTSQRFTDFQIIDTATIAGTVICTNEDPSICEKSQEGNVLEYNVGCNGTTPSSTLYICKQGRWQYIVWTDHGTCRSFCKK